MKNSTPASDSLMKTNPSLWKALIEYKKSMSKYRETPLSQLSAKELRQLAVKMLNEELPNEDKQSVITIAY